VESTAYQRQQARAQAGTALDTVKKGGMQVNELAPAELAKFREKMKPVVDKHGAAIAETVGAAGRTGQAMHTMINGNTELIAHIGYPTHAFKAPMIYNPYFDHIGVNACVVPMGCQSEDYPAFLRAVFTLTNIRGALITMPHKVATVACWTASHPR
jgi:hypothetical protein